MRSYIILAIIGLIQLLPKEASADTVALGGNCVAADTCTGGFCQNGVCKVKEAGDCSSDKSDKCLAHATCVSNVCACSTGYTVAADKQSCKVNLGGACTATDTCNEGFCSSGYCKLPLDAVCTLKTDKCLANGECTGASGTTCACKTGYTAATNKQSCSGASGVVASFVLLLVTSVTSRFM